MVVVSISDLDARLFRFVNFYRDHVLTPHLLACSTNRVIRTIATDIVHEVAVHNFTGNEVHGLFDRAVVSLTTANI